MSTRREPRPIIDLGFYSSKPFRQEHEAMLETLLRMTISCCPDDSTGIYEACRRFQAGHQGDISQSQNDSYLTPTHICLS